MSNQTSDSSHAIKVDQNDPIFKTVGITLAISSGAFIGVSFVLKKKGLLAANEFAGKGHAYLSNGLWWCGMILMLIGEICNFVAYAFTQAILVTPLGALSVVISAICSSIFLKERLNMQGKIGCAQCIIGAIIIVMHAPAQHSATSIEEFQSLFLSPGFLTYAIICVVLSGLIIWRLGSKYGSRNMLVYISVCSIIGSLSVVTTQGLGTAIIRAIGGDTSQFTYWFFYFLLAFIVITLLIEINYLNKALNLFNTAMVTPVYYVIFTSLTIISSSILTKGFEAPPQSVITVVLGFSVICSGIVLLQTSKGISVDARSSMIVPNKEDLESGGSTLDKNNLLLRVSYIEPGASEIRASFGSIKRYSRNFGVQIKDSATLSHDLPTSVAPPPTKTIPNKHKRSMSLSYENAKVPGGVKARNKEPIPQRSNSTKSMPDPIILSEFDEQEDDDEKRSRGQIVNFKSLTRKLKLLSPTTATAVPSATTSTTAAPPSSSVRKEKTRANKTLTIITPAITTTPPVTSTAQQRRAPPPLLPSASSLSSPNNNNNDNNNENENENDASQIQQQQEQHHYNHLEMPPLPSPLQHPINYIKQHLSPTSSSFLDTNDGIRNSILLHKGTNPNGRRSQNSMNLVDKMKLGTNSLESKDDHEVLMRQKSI